jgi:hypothetical protein
MAQKFMSPGVFTTEFDQSFLAQGVAGIGAALIGRTLKGPAFVPVIVQGFDSFAERFGATDPSLQMPYAAKNYLKNSGVLTAVRVLGHSDGTNTVAGFTVGAITAITDSGSNGQVLAVLHNSGTVTVAGVPGSSTDFTIVFGTVFGATASFVPTAPNYVGKVLNTDPTKYSTYGHYLNQLFKATAPAVSASWSSVTVSGGLTDFHRDFVGGSTAWIKSQPIGGVDFDLFRFKSVGHGNAVGGDVKVMITNIKPSASPTATPFGTFDVIVRDFDDTDQRPVVLESFIGCTLDPDSNSFISRKIGDGVEVFSTTQRKFIATGTFPSKSKYITVELSTTSNPPKEALPFGHRGYTKDKFSNNSLPADLPLVLSQKDRNGNQDANIAWGIMFVSGGIADRMKASPDNALTTQDADFSLSFLTSSYVNGRQVWNYSTAISVANQHQPLYASASLYKFSMPLQGGFDGFDPRVRDPLYLTNSADETDIGVVSLKRAIDTLANPDAFDLNLLAIPGVHNLKVTDYARSMVNDRQDVLFVMDITGSSVTEAVGQLKAREVDDNYTACYYPDLKLNDRTSNRMVRVSPSVAVVGAVAYSDRVGQVFFAPAGLNRGGLGQFDIADTVDRLNYQDRNDLYENRINPIATFPNEGIVVFGQKTLQIKASALDRINVRRLLIFAKKTIASAAKYLLFEPGNPATWQRFVNTVNPILDKIRQDQGIERFKVVMDSTVNTADVVDRNIMKGKIFLQPTKSAEFIDLSFIITNAGVSFGE